MSEYDVIVVGAGSVGVPIAMSLAEKGFKTLVIDKFPSPGQGENKHAIGGIRATHSQRGKIRLCLKSLEVFSTWKEKHGDDIDWVKGGYTFVAYTEEHRDLLKGMVADQRKVGLNINFVEADKIQEIVPGINPNGLLGGTWSPDDGNASPLLAINAFYRKAVELGAEFHFNELVEEIILQNNQVVGVRTSSATYQTTRVINAAGAFAKELAKTIGIELPVIPDSHEAGITEPMKKFFTPMVVDIRPSKDPVFGGSKNYYFYQNILGQIIFCITPNPPIVGVDKRETSKFLPQVAKRMVNLLPRLKNIKVRRTWRGLYPSTPDGNPIIGPVKEISGYYNAVGMCGQGYMLGPGLGEFMSRLIDNKLTSEDKETLEEFSLYRDFTGVEKLK